MLFWGVLIENISNKSLAFASQNIFQIILSHYPAQRKIVYKSYVVLMFKDLKSYIFYMLYRKYLHQV